MNKQQNTEKRNLRSRSAAINNEIENAQTPKVRFQNENDYSEISSTLKQTQTPNEKSNTTNTSTTNTLSNSSLTSIKPSEVIKEKLLGSGSFSEVWKGKYKDQDVAIKTLKKDPDVSMQELKEDLLNETTLMA